MNRQKRILLIMGGVILGLVIAAASLAAFRRTPDFRKMSDRQVLSYLASRDTSSLKPDALKALFERADAIPRENRFQFGSSLPEKQRDLYRENNQSLMEARLDRTIEEFFSLPPDKQDAFLDRQIQRMEERRAHFAGPGGSPGGPGFSPPAGAPPAGMSAVTPPAGGRGQWRRGGRTRDPAAMIQRRRNRLSHSTPEQRAKRTEYFRRMRARGGNNFPARR